MILASLRIKKLTTIFLDKLIVAQSVRKPKAHYYVHKSPPLASVLSQVESTP
jgi:hypothetical protein